VSKCWKQEKNNWKCLGSSSQDSAQSGSTGLSGGAPSGAPGRLGRTGRSREFIGDVRAGYNSPDCPVCTGLSGEPTVGRTNGRLRDPHETRGQANGREGAPDCPVRQRLSGCQRSASPFKERNPHRTVSGVHRTVRCARRQKARFAFLECSQRLLAALGL
jgi:hypothetical protein